MPNRGNQQSGSNRGFASMDESKQKQASSKGGKASHAKDSRDSGSKNSRSASGRNRG